MKVPSIFDFERFSPFFAAYFEWRKSVDPRFSYRWLERRINCASYSMLAMIATGRRLPSMQLLKELAPILNLEEDELHYAELMVELEKSNNPSTREVIRAKMQFFKPSAEGQQVTFDTMQFIGDWHHSAILQMFDLQDFRNDPTWIAARLQNLISPQQVSESLALLHRLDLVGPNEMGEMVRTKEPAIAINTSSKLAIKNYHKQFLDRAKDAVLAQGQDDQHLVANAITISKQNLPEMAKEIDQFMADLIERFASKEGDATYQLSLQLLPLTIPEVEANSERSQNDPSPNSPEKLSENNW
jgi:uncharacterized protein (TIGR02147 family)